MHHVVIIGGGFGGLHAARSLRKANVQVTLVDRHNHHLFQPLLYQVATGALSPANIAAPLRSLVRRQKNVQVLLGDVVDIDLAGRRVLLRDGELTYDTLIVAAGAAHSYFGHPEWEPFAPGIKTLDDATSIRRKILLAFETAERLGNPEEIAPWLTFVIVGGGPTGVEMAGAIVELAHETLRNDFRAIDPTTARIILVEAGERILPPFAPDLSAKARSALERMQVEVRTGALVTGIEAAAVELKQGDRIERIAAHTILWSAGVQASPLAKILAEKSGAELDRGGRVRVQPDLTIGGHPEVFVIGDMAHCPGADGKPLPGLAPVAMQQGNYAARQIAARLAQRALPPFHYRDMGTMATIGRMKAVCDIFGWRYSGPLAWLTWLFIHLMQIVQFQNRVLVLVQWAAHYITRNRSARLVTGREVGQAFQPDSHVSTSKG
ncbi:MAG: NAD(P)/FAD-dependent oxidoreductase [Planctomycetia bacterium]|nr:NAD(P)/FAD-dependent oxidoreductase [Planctomycetia bacterium]